MELLAERHNDGKVVKLWWDKNDEEHPIQVTVRDLYSNDNYTFSPPPSKALDAFNHPFAFIPERVTA